MKFDYYRFWMPSDFDYIPFAEAKDQCIGITNTITLPSSFTTIFPEGFTMRIWLKFMTDPASAELVDQSYNFFILKQGSSYSIRQAFPDSRLLTSALTVPNAI